MQLEGKRVAILGLGIEGVALLEFLKNRVGSLAVHDKSEAEKILGKAEGKLENQIQNILDDDDIKKVFGEKYLDDLEKYDIVFRSPGIYFRDPALIRAKAKGTVISSQMKLFFDLCPCPIIGVTGTKGKGTTASLISEILNSDREAEKQSDRERKQGTRNMEQGTRIYLAGNIGKPAITLIPQLQKYDTVILELSSFQLADLDKSPHIAVMTNLSVDHLDYHKDEAEYRDAKKNIVLWQGANDYAVFNHSSTFSPETLKKMRGQIKYFARDNNFVDCAVVDENGKSKVIFDPQDSQQEICEISDLKLVGKHNLENVAAATIVADILGISLEVVREAVKRFVGLPHRLELIREIGGIKFINDSFATNPDPTMAAVNSFDENKILILGGSSKGADFTKLAEEIASTNVKAVVLIGAEGEKIGQALKEAGYDKKVIVGGKAISEIVKQAMKEARRGDVVIFSPACASFDMFKNYKDRGEKFREAVMRLKQNE